MTQALPIGVYGSSTINPYSSMCKLDGNAPEDHAACTSTILRPPMLAHGMLRSTHPEAVTPIETQRLAPS